MNKPTPDTSIIVAPKKEFFGNSLSWKENFKRYKYIYILLIPVLAYYIIFKYIPMGGLIIAFQDYKPLLGYFGSAFVGFQNFIDYLTGPYSLRTIGNTLMINIYQLLIGFPAPIIFALLLNELKWKKFKAVNQTLSYLPHFVSAVVVAGLLTDFLMSDGFITTIVCFFTGQEAANLLANPDYFRLIYTLMGIWKGIGWGSIIYLATLSNADPTLYEAATIDGAGRIKQIIHITIPVLIPIIAIQLIMRVGSMMSEGYETILLLQNSFNMYTSDIISTYVYRRGIEELAYSYAAAVDLFNSVVNITLLCFANWFSKRYVKESLW